jgi:hypothetical protein
MNQLIDARSVLTTAVLLAIFAAPPTVAADGPSQEAAVDTSSGGQTREVRAMWMHELSAIKRDMNRPWCRLEKSKDRVVNVHSLIHPRDRTPVDVAIRRTEALLDDLQTLRGAPDLSWADVALAKLREQSKARLSEEQQTRIFLETCAVRRRLALSNPLLSFEKVVFGRGVGYRGCIHITPWGTGGGHQNSLIRNSPKESDWPDLLRRTPEGESEPDGVARPGLFVLSGYKTATPRVEPLFMDAVIENGRHRGKKLVTFPGECHSPST